MDDQERKQTLDIIDKFLQQPDCRIFMMREVIESGSENGWLKREAGKTLYVFMSVGPEDVQRENAIRSLLNHDIMGFRK